MYPILQNKKWLAEQLERFNDRQIAGMLNCCTQTVATWRRRHGLKPYRQGGSSIPQLNNRNWLERQLKSHTQKEIAEMLGCDQSTVSYWTSKYGLESRRVIDDEKLKETFAFIVEYREVLDGQIPSLREIRDACGYSSTSMTSTALKMLHERGLIALAEKSQARSFHVPGGRWVYEGEGWNGQEK
jgi:DNA-binding MarR family transcriptional regulator